MEFNINYWDMTILSDPRFYIGTLIFGFIAYLIGSINAGQILSILGSKDLGQEGSRNFGATNAGRAYGAKGFAAVFIFDMAKAIFAALILTVIMTRGFSNDPTALDPDYFFSYASIPLAMVWVVIGHSFPIYFGFRGGKGVATVFGSVLVLNWLFAIVAISVFAITILVTRWTSLGSIVGTLTGVFLVVFFHGMLYSALEANGTQLFFFWTNSWLNIVSALFLGLFIVVRHRVNLMRMFKGIDPVFKPKGWKPQEQKNSENE